MGAPAIDRSVFTELRDAVGPDFARELVDAFLEEAPTILADLRRAAQCGDADAYRRAAHTLKSNAATFGATQLHGAAREVELAGLADDPGCLDALAAALRAASADLDGLSRG